MSNSPANIPITIHPAIRSLNVRGISKMVATKIIEATALQLCLDPSFCNQLSVAQHLNTYEAVAYFTDNQYFEKYGFNRFTLISFYEIYEELWNEFKYKVNYQGSINEQLE